MLVNEEFKNFNLAENFQKRIKCAARLLDMTRQEALNTWRGRLQHFLKLLYNQKIQKVILI